MERFSRTFIHISLFIPLIPGNLWQTRKAKHSGPRLADLKLEPFLEDQRCGRWERLGVVQEVWCWFPYAVICHQGHLQTSSLPQAHALSRIVYSALLRSRETYFCFLLSSVWQSPGQTPPSRFINFICMCIWLYKFMCTTCMQEPREATRGHWSSGTAAIGSW